MTGARTVLRRSQRRLRCLRKGHAFQRYLGAGEVESCRRCGRRRKQVKSSDPGIPLNA